MSQIISSHKEPRDFFDYYLERIGEKPISKDQPKTAPEKPKAVEDEIKTKPKTEMKFEEVVDTALKIEDLMKRANFLLDFVESNCKIHRFDIAEKLIEHIPDPIKDQGYFIIAENLFLSKKIDPAILAGSKIVDPTEKSKILYFKIYNKCGSKGLSTQNMKIIAQNLNGPMSQAEQSAVFESIACRYLENNKITKAIKIADQMPCYPTQDEVRQRIIKKIFCQSNPDLTAAESVADKCEFFKKQIYHFLLQQSQFKNNAEASIRIKEKMTKP